MIREYVPEILVATWICSLLNTSRMLGVSSGEIKEEFALKCNPIRSCK